MTLELDDVEHRLIAEILDAARRQLVGEISRADHRELREELRRRELRLEGVLARLGVSVGRDPYEHHQR